MFPTAGLRGPDKPKPTALATVEQTAPDYEDWVVDFNGVWATSSLMVAKVFGKSHKNVIQGIENLVIEMYPIVEENFVAEKSAAKYFIEATYENRGKAYKMYYLTRDGFSLLVMGFTGKQALIFKMKYIEKFDAMENHINTQQLATAGIVAIAAQAATQAITAALPNIIKAVQGSQPQADTQLTRIADARLAVLPDTLTVKQVRIYLGVSNDRAYDLFHSADFPSYNIGRSLYVSKLGFIQWLSTTSKQGVFLG